MARSTSIVVRLSPQALAQVSEMAAAGSTSKSTVIAELVEKALSSAPASVGGDHYDSDVAELRAEYERARAALHNLERQVSSLAIRMRAFSGITIHRGDAHPPAPPAEPPDEPSATRSWINAEPAWADEVAPPTSPPSVPAVHALPTLPPPVVPRWQAPSASPLDAHAQTIDEILSQFED